MERNKFQEDTLQAFARIHEELKTTLQQLEDLAEVVGAPFRMEATREDS